MPLVLGGIAACALLASSDRLPSSLRSGIAAAVFGLVVIELFASPASRWRYPYFEGGHTRAYHEERDLYGPIAASDQRLWVWRRAFDSRMPPKVATVFRMRSIEDLEILTLRRQLAFIPKEARLKAF